VKPKRRRASPARGRGNKKRGGAIPLSFLFSLLIIPTMCYYTLEYIQEEAKNGETQIRKIHPHRAENAAGDCSER